ncbi:MAG: beta strand repeat-containing protein [Candidatus Spyradosoma sp.]
MKTSKLFITSLLAAAAMGVNAFADTTPLLPELSSTAITQISGSAPSGWSQDIGKSSISASAVNTDLGLSSALQSAGWHWGTSNWGNPGSDVTNVSESGFTYLGRGRSGGEYVAATINASSLLGENVDSGKVELNIGFSAVGQSTASFSIWSWNSTGGATEIYKTIGFSSTAQTIGFSKNVVLSSSDKLFVVWNDSSTGASNTISSLTSSYAVSTNYATLYWRGGDATWSSTSTTWNATSSETTGNVAATSFDEVIFDSSASVMVDDAGVAVDTLTISSGTVSFYGGAVAVKSGLALSDGTTLSLDGTSVNTGFGTTTIGANAQLTVSGDGALNTTISSVGANAQLVLGGTGASAVTISGVVGGKSGSTVTNATINVSGGNSVTYTNTTAQELRANIYVSGAGSTFTQSGNNGADQLNYSGSTNGTISVSDGGTLALGSNRWTISGTYSTISLDGGNITGSSQTAGTNKYGNLDFNAAKTIRVGNTYGKESNISASIRLRSNLTFVVADGATLNITGRIANADSSSTNGKLIKSGAGTLTLDIASTAGALTESFAGGLDVNDGKVVVKNTDALGTGTTRGAVSVASDAVLELAAATGTVSNVISGAGAIKKTGTGTVTLAGANTSYSGQTTVENGTLVAGNASALGTSNVVVADGATLERGLASGSVTIGGTLTTNGAAILSTGVLNADTAAFAVTGAVTLDASTKFELGSIGDGVILLQSDASITGAGSLSTTNITVNGAAIGSRTGITLSADGKTLSLTQNALALTWAGGDSGTWKTNGSGWTAIDAESPTFQTGDSVEFTSSNAGTVSVDGAVSLDTMTVSSGTYTFNAASGGGKIYSMGAVTVANGATMNLNGDVLGSLGGGLVVQNGGALNVSAAVTTPSALSVETGGTATFTAAGTFATISVDGTLSTTAALTSTGALNVGGTLTSSAAVSATQLSGSGRIDLGSTGSLSLSNSTKFNNWTGTVAFKDRTITHTAFSMANYGTTGSTIEFSGVDGVFSEYAGTVNANLHLVNSTTSGKNYGYKVMNGTSTGAVTFAGKITGTGDIVMAWGTGTAFTFTGNVSEFEGKFSNTGKTSGTNTNVVLTFSGTPQLSEGQSSVSGKGNIEWGNNCSVVYNYGAADVQADNKIVSAILKKQGTGSLKLTQANTYTGGTTVEAGTLIAGNASALGTGPVTVNASAKLQVKAGMNVTVSTAASTTVTLAPGAKLVVDFADVVLPAGAQEQTFQIMTAAVFSVYGSTLSEGDVTANMSGAWELLNGDDAWLNSAKWTLAGNTLSLTMTIPEPSVFGLLAGLGALALAGSRRRRRKA